MNRHLIYFITVAFISNVYANDTILVDEEELKKWGYLSTKSSRKDEYKKLNELEGEISYRHQSIKSIRKIPGYEHHYYYYTLSEECFFNSIKAFKRKLSFGFLDDKDYRVGEINGKCIYIVDTAAKLGTFEEQSRIFKLFVLYMEKERHNQALNSQPSAAGTPKSGAH